MSKEPLLTFESRGDITSAIIRSSSVLDALNVVTFGKEVVEYVREHHIKNLLLDFRHVTYLSSAVLTELIRVKEMLEEDKGNLRLCALNADIKKVFEITNLDSFFVIYDSADDAVKRFKRSLMIQAQDEAWADELPEGQ